LVEAAGDESGRVAPRDVVIGFFGSAGVGSAGVVAARAVSAADVVVALAVGVMVVVVCGATGSLAGALAVGALGTAIGAGGVRVLGSAAPGDGGMVGSSDTADGCVVDLTGAAMIDGCIGGAGAAAGRSPRLGTVKRTTEVTDAATTARNVNFRLFDVPGPGRIAPFDAPSVVTRAGVAEAGAPGNSAPEPVR